MSGWTRLRHWLLTFSLRDTGADLHGAANKENELVGIETRIGVS
jgi:hypothetical protein